MWVRLLKLLMKFWVLNRIGSLFGVPIAVDECTSNQTKVGDTRILIKIDISKSLPQMVLIKDEEGQTFEQPYFVEWGTSLFVNNAKQLAIFVVNLFLRRRLRGNN